MSSLIVLMILLAICAAAALVLSAPFRKLGAKAAPEPARTDLAGDARAAGGEPEQAAAGEEKAGSSDERERLLEEKDRLLQEKDRLLQALADLRFDFEAGKLAPEDFHEEDERLRARAAAVLQELDGSGLS